MKPIEHSQIKVTGNTAKGKVYLNLELNYGYSENGVRKRFRHASGLTVTPSQWIKGEFSNRFISDEVKTYREIIKKIGKIKDEIVTSYNMFVLQKDRKPSPNELKRALERQEVKEQKGDVQRTALASWIERTVPTLTRKDDQQIIAYSTQQKLLTVGHLVEATEKARRSHPVFRTMAKGEGKIYIETFSQEDWHDINKLMDYAAKDIHLFREDITKLPLVEKDKHGIPVKAGGYAQTTKSKNQLNLKQLLRKARRNGYHIPLHIEDLDSVSRGDSSRLFYFEPEEIEIIMNHRFEDSDEENARKLLMIHIFLGCRISDMQRILEAPLEYTKGIPIIQYISVKTGIHVVAPVFDPILSMWTDKSTQPKTVIDQTLNKQLKRICKKMKLKRKIMFMKKAANGKMTELKDMNNRKKFEKEVPIKVVNEKVNEEEDDEEEENNGKNGNLIPLHKMVSSHTGRKTLYSILSGDLGVKEVMVTWITGHITRKEAHLAYYAANRNRNALLLYQQIQHLEWKLPFTLASSGQQQRVPEPPQAQQFRTSFRM